MNIQSGKLRDTRQFRKSSGRPLAARLVFAFEIGAVLLVIAVLLNGYIYLNQKIAETEREIRVSRKLIHDTDREIANLRIRCEQLSAWPHIRDSIARYKLALKAPEPRQVRRLAIIEPEKASRIAAALERRRTRAGLSALSQRRVN